MSAPDTLTPAEVRARLAKYDARRPRCGRPTVDGPCVARRGHPDDHHQPPRDDDPWAMVQALLADVDRVCEERDELAATLANERGEGAPPSEGWEASLHNGRPRWGRDLGEADHLLVSAGLGRPGWRWRRRHPAGNVSGADGFVTARQAMIRADAALAAGGTDHG